MFRSLRRQLKKINIDSREKQELREGILGYIKQNPCEDVRKTGSIRQIFQVQRFNVLLTNKPMFITVVVALVALVSGGTALAAENTLPGDVLYPVKVYVNEEVRASFANTDEERAEWEATLAQRRMIEATLLAQRGELREDLAVKVESRLSMHIQKTETLIDRLNDEGKTEEAAEAQAKLDALIRLHQDLLARLDEIEDEDDDNNTTTSTPNGTTTSTNSGSGSTTATSTTSTPENKPTVVFNPFKNILHNVLGKNGDVKKHIEEKIDERFEDATEAEARAAAEQLKVSTEAKISKVATFLADTETKLGEQEKASAEYTAAVTLKASADAKLAANQYQEAFELYLQAQAKLVSVKVLLNAELNADFKDEWKQWKEDKKEQNDEWKEERKENKEEAREDRRDNRDERRDDREDRREDRKDLRNDVRDLLRF